MNITDGGKGKGNRTGIGIEIARSRSDLETFRKAEENGAKLTAWILQRYGWGIERVYQHADFSKKNCPHRTRELGWNRFLGMVQKYLKDEHPAKQFPTKGKVTVGSLNVRPTAGVNGNPIGKLKLNEIIEITGVASNGWYEIDYKGQIGYVSNLYITITQYGDSYSKPSEVVKKKYPITGLIKNPNSSKYIINKLNVIETTPENIEIIPVFGKAMRQTGKSGINGTFFDTSNPVSTRSIWGLAVNDSKPIGENAHTNHWNGTKRGTMSWFGGNKVYNQYINNINDYSQMPIWAIGGMNLISRGNPDAYNPKLERVPEDWTRRTYHTAIAYKQGKIYLITSVEEVYLNTFKNMIESAIDPDSCINLDGGGSTQMSYGGKFFGNSARRLSNAVVIKRL